ncbi:MAG TPA: TetR/AcrR family transcriptional regulator, partial [Bacteroidetes bacterium]|nr:TetR/AcrR family transcriptional regulator [Bacteroidota bacterium]
LFWKRGYHATSIQDLVNHLGISRSSIYDTYGGKKALYNQALNAYRTSSTAGVSTFLQNQTNVKTGLRELFFSGIQSSLTDPDNKGCFVINTTTEMLPGDPEIQSILEENYNTFEDLFYRFLRLGEKRWEIPEGKDLRTIAGLLFTLYNGMKVVAKVQTDQKKLMAEVDAVLALLD